MDTTADTGGCSATQIGVARDLPQSQYRDGITRKALEDWIADRSRRTRHTPSVQPESEGDERNVGLRRAQAFVVNSLAARAQSVAEIEAKLARRGVAPDDAAEVVRDALRLGYLDDEALATQLAQGSRTRRHGRGRAARDLRRRRLPEPEIAAALEAAYADVDERKLAAAALGSRPCGDERERRRAVAYLVRRGFSTGTAWQVVRSRDGDAPGGSST